MTTVTTGLKFTFESPINRETTAGISERLSKNTTSELEIHITEDGNGSVTWSVEELDIEEGIGLWFDDDELVDYDGVFELPKELIDKLEELGYDVEYAK